MVNPLPLSLNTCLHCLIPYPILFYSCISNNSLYSLYWFLPYNILQLWFNLRRFFNMEKIIKITEENIKILKKICDDNISIHDIGRFVRFEHGFVYTHKEENSTLTEFIQDINLSLTQEIELNTIFELKAKEKLSFLEGHDVILEKLFERCEYSEERFERLYSDRLSENGFSWRLSIEGGDFWREVLYEKNTDYYYENIHRF